MIKQEWKKLLRNPILILVLVVIMLIPSMYAGLFLSSMWDPYGELNKLPVAVVNLDEEVEFNGQTLNVGATLVDNLKENGALDFHFVNASQAKEGLEAGTYYMVITIPSDFSYKASTATDFEPQTMQLLYETNPASNYVATKLSQSAMNKIELSLQESVSKSYIEALIENINGAGSGLQDAADGTSQLLDGANQVVDGVDALSNGTSQLRNGAATLNDGASNLRNGAATLSDGASALSDGATAVFHGTVALQHGAVQLNNGANALGTGLNDYLNGASSLNTGISQLYGNLPALIEGVNSLDSGAQALVTGNGQVVAGFEGPNGALAGATALSNGAAQLNGLVQNAGNSPLITLSDDQINAICGAASSQAAGSIGADNQIVQLVAAGLMVQYASAGTPIDADTAMAYAISYVQQLTSAVASGAANGTATQVVAGINGALPSTLGVYTAQLSDGAAALNTGLNQLYGGALQIQTGLVSLHNGTSELANSAVTLSSGVEALSNGAAMLVSNNYALAHGVNEIVAGSGALADGATTLNNGARELASGAADLSDGASALSDGATLVYNGTTELSNGAIALDDGVNELQDALPELTDGIDTLLDGLSDGADEISSANLGANNASMMANPVDTVETQITTVDNNGTAMAAYMMSVGLWVACLAFCLMYPLTEHDNLKNGFCWWASKASVLFPIAVIQGVILVGVLRKFLGFNPVDLGGTILVSVLASVAFMAIMYFFNALIGKVGSFIMLVFMVFQLAGSAGTYPIELSGPLANALHKFVPFTYTVKAFRSTIGGGAGYTDTVVILLVIIAAFTLMTLWLFQARSLKEKHGKENVHDFLEAKGLA